ncbi:MAG: phosphate ABC transporter substrate-binding protein PstS [Terriglobia bacterium]
MTPGSRFRTQFKRLLLALTAWGLLANLFACSRQGSANPKPRVPPGGVLLQGAGATFPSPLYQQWFATYQQSHPQTVVTYDSVGSGEGIRRFMGRDVKGDERVDFGASDAALQDSDIALVPEGVVMLPVTAGGVALAYNLPGVAEELKLSRRAYAGIFLGEIKNWSDPVIATANPGVKLPKLTIVTVVRQDASGTTFAFTKHLDAISEEWRGKFGPSTLVDWPGNAMRAKGNEGVAGLLSQSIGSLGYVGYEFAHKYGLRVARIENQAGKFVLPNEESLRAALSSAQMPENMRVFVPDPAGPEAYPIATFTWILLRKSYGDSAKAQSIRDLFAWTLGDGQQFASSLGYVPLPAEVVGKAQAALQTVKP